MRIDEKLHVNHLKEMKKASRAEALDESGSFGNGACMRIAPVGLVYRAASDEELRRRALDAVVGTHSHPLALDAATVLARCVACAANGVSDAEELLAARSPSL